MSEPRNEQGLEYRLNGICPYFTMFPLSFPLEILGKNATGEGWVLDPFCGRGTTNFAARVLGLPSAGIDVSPIAVAITEAKMVGPSPDEIADEAADILEASHEPVDVPRGEFWDLAYDPNVLRDLCRFREALMEDCSSPARIALRGIILGALHGPLTKATPSYFSNQAPRTFAPKPAYSVSFWRKRGLRPPQVDALKLIRTRADRYYSQHLPDVAHLTFLGDSADSRVVARLREFWHRVNKPCKWIITSPPYFGMSTYIPDQWLRNWFLGGPAKVEYRSSGQIGRGSREAYCDKLSEVWRNIGEFCSKTTRMVVRFGFIGSSPIDAEDVFSRSLKDTGWKIQHVAYAGDSRRGRRQADAFSRSQSEPPMEVDIYCTRA